MEADFKVKWLKDRKRFEPCFIKVDLRKKGDDDLVAMKVKEIIVEPKGIYEVLEETARSTPKFAILKAMLTKEVMADEDFYKKIKQPVHVEIVAEPVAEQTANAITAGDTEVRRKCTVGTQVPEATIHWKDLKHPELGDDCLFEVEADGEDDMRLEVWVERYIPSKGVVDKDDTVHFSHKTGPMFRARIFGPHPEDYPWEVAKPGSGNRRDRSHWKSNAFLPDTRHPEALPLYGHIRCRSWEAEDITGRAVNQISIREGTAKHIVEHEIPVRLVPIKITVDRLDPDEPVAADGQPHRVALLFTRTRTGAPVKQGEFSWELVAGADQPGGTADPMAITLAEADQGKAEFEYTPPALVYAPGKNYKQGIKAYSGTAEKRIELNPTEVFVSPEVKATLTAKKDGIDFKEPFVLTIEAGESPEEIIGHVGFASEEADCPEDLPVRFAQPIVKIQTEAGEVEVPTLAKTGEDGLYTWLLPELADGLQGMPETRRKRTLEPFVDEQPGEFTDRGLEILEQYRAYLNNGKAREVLDRLLSPPTIQGLKDQPMVMARSLAKEMEEHFEKAHQGTVIVVTAMRGTVLMDALHASLFDRMLDLVVKFLWDALDLILKLTKVVEKLFKWLGDTKIAKAAGPAIDWVKNKLDRFVYRFVFAPMVAIQNYLESRAPSVAGAIDRLLKAIGGGGSWMSELRGLILDLQTAIAASILSIVRTCETAAVAIIADPDGLLGDVLKPGAKKAAEKLVKEISKAVQKMLSAAGGRDHTYAELKNELRSDLSVCNFKEVADPVMAFTSANVVAFTHPAAPENCRKYIATMEEMQHRNLNLDDNVEFVDEIVSTIDKLCDGLMVAAVIVAIVSGGTLAVGSAAVLSTVGTGKLFGKVVVHYFQGLQIGIAAGNIMDLYEQDTRAISSVESVVR